MKVLVYGWYHHQNLGDDLFIDAFQNIFPELNFTFTDHITENHLIGFDIIFFGGGSFIDQKPQISDQALQILSIKSVFYIGVGAESDIHPIHQQLIKQAKLIAIRSDHLDKISQLNKNVIKISDLVYSLNKNFNFQPKQKSILIIPNISVVPKTDEPNWKHQAWNYFKSEFGQSLNEINKDYKINFLSMCNGDSLNDNNAAIELINQMNNRNNKNIINIPNLFEKIIELISSYQLVITQRFHGIILSQLAQTNYISIYHHDKLKEPDSLYYYGLSKNILLEKFREKINNLPEKSSNINPYIFEGFRTKILLELGKIDGKISGNEK